MANSFGRCRRAWKRDSPLDRRLQGPARTSSVDERLLYYRYPCIITSVQDYSACAKPGRLNFTLAVNICFLLC